MVCLSMSIAIRVALSYSFFLFSFLIPWSSALSFACFERKELASRV